jgi:hypothetical protein
MMQAAANSADANLPFTIRPGLVSQMVRFYDDLRRHGQTVARFEELMEATLAGADVDRGAERLLRQTRFLAAAFRRYEHVLSKSGACDEHLLRSRLLAEEPADPVPGVIVTVADWIADRDGLFVADFDLLARVPHLKRIDLVCTEGVLGSGFHERIHGWWPGLEEASRDDIGALAERVTPRLVTPQPGEDLWFTYRDREEELIAVARRAALAQAERRTALVVFKRPLPYLYLANDVFGAARIGYETVDALPLAADPGAAVVDLVLEAVEARFTRMTLVALLRCPYLRWPAAKESARAEVSTLDRQLSVKRYLGDLQRLTTLADNWLDAVSRDALDAAIELARELSAFLTPASASTHLRKLATILETWFPVRPNASSPSDRESAVRQTLLQTLTALAAAHEQYHDVDWTIDDLANAVRRAIGDQTLAPATGDPSGPPVVRLVDDRAARYADCDEMTLVGVIENEWPEKPHRNIFYSTGLLKTLGWPSEKDRRAAADARFVDLLGSASDRVVVSTMTLDDEASRDTFHPAR